MAQGYITSYINDYRRHDEKREPPIIPGDMRFHCDDDKALWMDESEFGVGDISDLTKGAAMLKMMRMRRMISTYRQHYCEEKPKQDGSEEMEKEPFAEDLGFENALLENCKILYGRKTKKLLPPITTGRRINGYMRSSRFYTPLTVYQKVHGQVGYKILERNQQQQ
ncbi:unnamed protein product [Acanthoscelides obtectus]|uniref:Uncharacterized protein n=1 Tax=Acanthoscelides obtectus TaxID=200917 RepID=A0A9P0KR49_ACAOB|nr:unnamed protein product [Acanthoscelides obtectus]CAK1637726.1 hypothetical protein AOBTE_LOCUS10155 [Acanthoscelides obtectus]